MTSGPTPFAAMTGLALLAACTPPSPIPQGRWTGALTPTPPSPACEPSRATLQIAGDIVTFAPTEGTWILQGVAALDGTLSAERSRLGIDKRIFETTLDARWTPGTIEGTYTTPRCHYAVALKR